MVFPHPLYKDAHVIILRFWEYIKRDFEGAIQLKAFLRKFSRKSSGTHWGPLKWNRQSGKWEPKRMWHWSRDEMGIVADQRSQSSARSEKAKEMQYDCFDHSLMRLTSFWWVLESWKMHINLSHWCYGRFSRKRKGKSLGKWSSSFTCLKTSLLSLFLCLPNCFIFHECLPVKPPLWLNWDGSLRLLSPPASSMSSLCESPESPLPHAGNSSWAWTGSYSSCKGVSSHYFWMDTSKRKCQLSFRCSMVWSFLVSTESKHMSFLWSIITVFSFCPYAWTVVEMA